MNLLLNPCRCQCDKEITRSELIVIMKKNSEQKRQFNEIMASQNKIGAVAMEPKSMIAKRPSLFKSKTSKQVDLNQLQPFLYDSASQDINEQIESKKFERNSSDETTLINFKSHSDISKPSFIDKSKDQKFLKEKLMNNNQIEEQTYRKTMKKHKNPPRQIKDQTKDMLLTTKRCKKKYNGLCSPPEQNKQDLSLIEQCPKPKIFKQKGKQNKPKNAKNFCQPDQLSEFSQKTVKFMIDEISLLKKQLTRLEEDEKRLIKERDQNEKFFQQDYAIHQKKKENLKKSCQERYNEINDLKKLLLQCKSRAI